VNLFSKEINIVVDIAERLSKEVIFQLTTFTRSPGVVKRRIGRTLSLHASAAIIIRTIELQKKQE